MHASSLENMQRCYEEFLAKSALLDKNTIRVLDIGGANVNGSYSDIFSDAKFQYVAVDLADGPGVEVVLDDAYHLPFRDAEFDIVVSGQVFEHAEFFWLLFEEMTRIVNRKGFIFLVVPSAGPIHRHPVDCYRFYPDSMRALANYSRIPLIGHWLDDRGPWNDLVGIFSHDPDHHGLSEKRQALPVNRFVSAGSPAPDVELGKNPGFEIAAGKLRSVELLRKIHSVFKPRSYLEIGVRYGESLSLARCHSIGVDPNPVGNDTFHNDALLFTKSSDAFFREDAAAVLGNRRPDLIFIDGMHLFEFALRDFINAERYSLPGTLIVVDDIYPNHPVQSERIRRSNVWTGDVWKLLVCLGEYRPDLLLMPVDTYPAGTLLIAGLDPGNSILREQYNPLVARYGASKLNDHETEILQRKHAVDPGSQLIDDLLQSLLTDR